MSELTLAIHLQIISKIMTIKYVSHDPITKALHPEHHNSCWCFNIPFAEYFRLFSLNILLVISWFIFCAYRNPVCPSRSNINSLLQSIVWSLLNQVTLCVCYFFDRIPVPIVIHISSDAFTYFILSPNNSTFSKQ